MKEIELTQGKICIVDDADFAFLNMFPWHFKKCYLDKGYAVYRAGKYNKDTYMHRLIMQEELKGQEDLVIDHIDRNGLNNQRINLRVVTVAQNSSNRSMQSNNTSGVTGVAYCKLTRKWKVNFKGQSRGYFIEFDDAVAARRFIEETEGVF